MKGTKRIATGRGLLVLLAVALGTLATATYGQNSSYPPVIPGALAEVYRSADSGDLKAWIFEPEGHSAEDERPAIVFFFGGGWNSGTPTQFVPQSRHLAQRGMVAIVVDYRVRSRQGTLANVAVSDAKAAVRWVRTHADRLGIDPDRIAAGGGSAGGHLAAATTMLPGNDDTETTAKISPAADALVLFNPALILAHYDGETDLEAEKLDNLRPRLGSEPESMSPYHNVRPGLPPTIIFHGKTDKTVPYRHAELFADAMVAAGNRCELVGYEDQGHGFFNQKRGDGSSYRDTTRRMDEFLVSLGWLDQL